MFDQIQQELLSLALAEDVGAGDLSASLITEKKSVRATVISREQAIICGAPWFNRVFQGLDLDISIQWLVMEGMKVQPNQELCSIEGPVHALLTGERTALNFLQLLSGTATVTHEYVQLIKGTSAKILDTRKTIPGLRHAQKYAVKCGGGFNHRKGLYDAILIKENHIAACGTISAAVKLTQLKYPQHPLIVEVENFAELEEALACKVRHILLDNFTYADLVQAVQITQKKAILEASGGITRDNIRSIAETGVDFISVGALTKHLKAVDFSMRLV